MANLNRRQLLKSLGGLALVSSMMPLTKEVHAEETLDLRPYGQDGSNGVFYVGPDKTFFGAMPIMEYPWPNPQRYVFVAYPRLEELSALLRTPEEYNNHLSVLLEYDSFTWNTSYPVTMIGEEFEHRQQVYFAYFVNQFYNETRKNGYLKRPQDHYYPYRTWFLKPSWSSDTTHTKEWPTTW